MSQADEAMVIDVEVTRGSAVGRCLDSAIEEILPFALQDGTKGILVTRVYPGRYTVELNGEAAVGDILEQIVS